MKRGLRDVKGVIELPKKPRQGDLLRLARQIKQANLHGVLERLTTIAEKAHDPAAAEAKAKTEQDRKQANTFRNVATRYMALEAGMKLDDDGNPIKFDEKKMRTGRERWLMLERSILPTLGSQPISDIRKSDVIRLLDRIATGTLKGVKGGETAADRALAVIRRIMSWHATREDDFRSPIVSGLVRVTAAEHARSRVLNDAELQAIWTTAEQTEGPFPAFILFSLLTCSRRSEAAGLRWAEIDADGAWELPAERSKTKVPVLRPLSKLTLDLLAKQPRTVGCDWVFSSDGRSPISGYSKLKDKFDAAVKKLHPDVEISDWRIHDLRRTARSRMSKAGVLSDHAERCLGHLIGGVRGVYDRHEYYDEKKSALQKLAAQLIADVYPAPSNVVKLKTTGGEGC